MNDRKGRAISTDVELFNTLYNEKLMGSIDARAFATLGKDVNRPDLNVFWKKGTRVKVVMVSRLGDFGLTLDLKADHGYSIRVEPGQGWLEDINLENEEDWIKYHNALDYQLFTDKMCGTTFATDHPEWFPVKSHGFSKATK